MFSKIKKPGSWGFGVNIKTQNRFSWGFLEQQGCSTRVQDLYLALVLDCYKQPLEFSVYRKASNSSLSVTFKKETQLVPFNHQMVTCTFWRRNKSSQVDCPGSWILNPGTWWLRYHIAPTYRYVSKQPKCNTLKNTLLAEPTFEVLNDQTKHRSSFVPMVRYGTVCV